jgi:hypothetical protein
MEFSDPAFHIIIEDNLVWLKDIGLWSQNDAIRYAETIVTLSQYVPPRLVVICDVTQWVLPEIPIAVIVNKAHRRVFTTNTIEHLAIYCNVECRKKYIIFTENLTLKHIQTPFATLTSKYDITEWLKSINQTPSQSIALQIDALKS